MRLNIKARLSLGLTVFALQRLALGLTSYRRIDVISTDLFEVTRVDHPKNNTAQEIKINNNGIAKARVRLWHRISGARLPEGCGWK